MAAFVQPIITVVDKVLGAVLPDKAAKDAASAHLIEMQVSGELQKITGQLDIDKAEAASQSVFVAGWRPFIGWICGAALGWNYLLRPTLLWIAVIANHTVVLQALDLGELMPLLLGMLGLGAMRTVEKLNGTSAGH